MLQADYEVVCELVHNDHVCFRLSKDNAEAGWFGCNSPIENLPPQTVCRVSNSFPPFKCLQMRERLIAFYRHAGAFPGTQCNTRRCSRRHSWVIICTVFSVKGSWSPDLLMVRHVLYARSFVDVPMSKLLSKNVQDSNGHDGFVGLKKHVCLDNYGCIDLERAVSYFTAVR